jgi:hypothetical protein
MELKNVADDNEKPQELFTLRLCIKCFILQKVSNYRKSYTGSIYIDKWANCRLVGYKQDKSGIIGLYEKGELK